MAANGRALAGGMAVFVGTASIALIIFVQPQPGLSYQLAGVALIVLLLIGALLLARFIRRHGDEIGEARFDTRNKDEREG